MARSLITVTNGSIEVILKVFKVKTSVFAVIFAFRVIFNTGEVIFTSSGGKFNTPLR